MTTRPGTGVDGRPGEASGSREAFAVAAPRADRRPLGVAVELELQALASAVASTSWPSRKTSAPGGSASWLRAATETHAVRRHATRTAYAARSNHAVSPLLCCRRRSRRNRARARQRARVDGERERVVSRAGRHPARDHGRLPAVASNSPCRGRPKRHDPHPLRGAVSNPLFLFGFLRRKI